MKKIIFYSTFFLLCAPLFASEAPQELNIDKKIKTLEQLYGQIAAMRSEQQDFEKLYEEGKGFFDFLWESNAQKRRHEKVEALDAQIRALEKQIATIRSTLSADALKSKKNNIQQSLNVYQNIVALVSRSLEQQQTTPTNPAILARFRVAQERIPALQKQLSVVEKLSIQ